MRQLLTVLAIAATTVGLACAESFSGTLLDATCAMQQQSQGSGSGSQGQNQQSNSMQSCTPTSSTTSFALQTSTGKMYQLDSTGNTKAAEALRNQANRSASGSSSTSKTPVMATVNGKTQGNTIEVETVTLQ